MRTNKMIAMRKIFDLLSNSLNQVLKGIKCMEISLENLYVDTGIYRVKIERFHSPGQHLCKLLRTNKKKRLSRKRLQLLPD